MGEQNIGGSGFQSQTVCSSCGLPIEAAELGASENNDEALKGMKICSLCTLNHASNPVFAAVVAALATGYFTEKMGFKDHSIAVQKAWDTVTRFPYWQAHENEWIAVEKLQINFNLDASAVRILSLLYKKIKSLADIEFMKERPDIFISHSWNGPEAELVIPLVNKLKEIGYTVWFDKEQGLKPGELGDYLKNAILDSKNCIPIICKEYFNGTNTKFELETIFNSKETKHIIPVWWSDVDKEFLKSQPILGEQIFKCAGVAWDAYRGNVEVLGKALDTYLIASEDLELYNGAKVYESEAHALYALEKVIGEKIPLLPDDSAQSSASIHSSPSANPANSTSLVHSTLSFGFKVENMHVVELVLSKTEGNVDRKPFALPESCIKFTHLRKVSAPLLKIPDYVGRFTELIDLDLHGGLIEYIPESLINLKNLETLNLVGNPLNLVAEGKGQAFLEIMIKKMNLYQDLSVQEGCKLYILQCGMGFDKEIPRVEKFRKYTFGYTVQEGSIKDLGLYDQLLTTFPKIITKLTKLTSLDLGGNKITSLPESIGNLKGLQTLGLWQNELTSIPQSIGNLQSLEILDLESNQLTLFPEIITKIKCLKCLYLEFNKLTSIPEDIGIMQSLSELNLYDNQLTSLPENIGNLKSLTKLKLYRNKLTTLPESIGNLQSLKLLNLESNQLISFPEGIGNMQSLENLTLYDNQLTSLPENIGNLQRLTELNLSSNELTSLPETIGKLQSLIKLFLYKNKLTSLPNTIGNLQSLQELDIDSNKLTSLPELITKMTWLKRLNISRNGITSLPETIEKWLLQLKKNGSDVTQ